MNAERGSDLVEIMAFDPHEGVRALEQHLQRLKRQGDVMGFAFDRHSARNELQAATFRAEASMVRLAVSPSGAIAIELRPLPPRPREPVAVALAAPDRPEAPGAFDTLTLDPSGRLGDGARTALFVEAGDILLTPSGGEESAGFALKQALLAEGRAREAELEVADLKNGFLVGDPLAGLLRARLA